MTQADVTKLLGTSTKTAEEGSQNVSEIWLRKPPNYKTPIISYIRPQHRPEHPDCNWRMISENAQVDKGQRGTVIQL